MKTKNAFRLLPALLIAVTAFGQSTPFVLKWDATIATPGRRGLVTLAPGTAVTLEAGRTNEVFRILGVKVPETEEAHRAVSLEFRYRFLQGTNEIADGTIRTDQHGAFVPAEHPAKPWFPRREATQPLSSTETFVVPEGADTLELERVAVDTLNGIKKVGARQVFDLVGDEKAFLVASGDTRGDTKFLPEPFLLGGPVTAGKPLSIAFQEIRAMNHWVRTERSKTFGGGIIATRSGSDIRTMTCVNKKPNVVYYSAWADLPLFEATTLVRFDEGDWQELPMKKLFPVWGSGKMQELFPFPFDTVAGLFRAADPHHPKHTASLFPKAGAKLAPVHLSGITVPSGAKTLSVKTRIHAYLIPHYGKHFEGREYVGDDCTRLFEDMARIDLQLLWDTPDFTEKTSWTFPVN